MFFLHTKNGYSADEALSALQKSVRRGEEKEAMYWALEMCPDFESHLWNRIVVIAYEDISSLSGNIPIVVSRMRDDYFRFRETGNSAALLVLANAVLVLCQAPKTRIADNFVIALGNQLDNGLKLEVPDYALDGHTGRGRRKGRGGEYFVKEGTKLINQADIKDPYKDEAEGYLTQGKTKISSFDWVKKPKKAKQQSKKELPEQETENQ